MEESSVLWNEPMRQIDVVVVVGLYHDRYGGDLGERGDKCAFLAQYFELRTTFTDTMRQQT